MQPLKTFLPVILSEFSHQSLSNFANAFAKLWEEEGPFSNPNGENGSLGHKNFFLF